MSVTARYKGRREPMPVLQLPRSDAPPWRARALVFDDPLSHELLTRIEQVAPTDATVLITGETGTGKEIVARHVHERSGRARAPFVAVNCGALSPSLMESELFGHEKAAFTGALSAKPGWFEAANGGTLFLDEIGDLPLAAQVKLLRVLQEREVVRIGARRPIAIDVRLVAATNTNLAQAVREGRFREDLFYRLHVAHLTIAPLRDRPGDVLPLARHFLETYAARLGLRAPVLTDDAESKLLSHPWPGNIRELENALHRALLVARPGRVSAEDLNLLDAGPSRSPAAQPGPASSSPSPSPSPLPPPTGERGEERRSLESALLALFEREGPNLHGEIEETVFRVAYTFCENNQLRTARLLGVSRNIVRARLMQYGLLPASTRERPEAVAPGSEPTPFALRAPSSPVRVRVGYQAFGVLPLLKATSALEDAVAARGALVEWVTCATGMQVVDALAAGALDVGVVGEAPPIFAQAARAPVVYLAGEPPAPEEEAIVVHDDSPVRTLADLRGKTIAVTRGANVVYFVVRALEEAGLELRDLELRSLAPAEARGLFLSRRVDAWATWNPLLASVCRSAPTRVLRDARGLANNRAFYVGRRAFADKHPDLVEAFLGQVGSVGRWANESRGDAARALAPHVDLPADMLEASLARTPFDARPIDDEAVASQQHIADTFHRLSFITRRLRVGEAVWTPPWTERRSA
ncbi:MAG TPA: aliphatic sulfonate ABC transporter substrate-binding protein [Polyangiaceae bacterium]|nr:aliphatic sulfonate ABC transporter substrate-binding protein [Polyangiaceae bacterium]